MRVCLCLFVIFRVYTLLSYSPSLSEALLLGLIRTHVNLSAGGVSVCYGTRSPPSVLSSNPREFDCTLLEQSVVGVWRMRHDCDRPGVLCRRVPQSYVQISDRQRCRFLTETSRLCDLVCDDGTRIKVRCGIQGHLLEMNSRLKLLPDLINTKVHSHLTAALVLVYQDMCR